MRLHLVRHGESTWNLEGRVQGQAMAPPLTPRGRLQAREAAESLRGRPVAAVISSDLTRAVQTATTIAGVLGLEVHQDARLREQCLGELEGRLSRELAPEPVPEGVDISEIAWGGGESLHQVHRRQTDLVASLASDFDDDAELVLVGHADALRVLCAVLDGRSHREVEWTPWPHGHVVVIDRRLPDDRWR